MPKTKEIEVEAKRGESVERAEYRRMIEVYEKQNPAKFAAKKERLLATLATL